MLRLTLIWSEVKEQRALRTDELAAGSWEETERKKERAQGELLRQEQDVKRRKERRGEGVSKCAGKDRKKKGHGGRGQDPKHGALVHQAGSSLPVPPTSHL